MAANENFLESSGERIKILQKVNHAILAFNGKLEQVMQFQDKIDSPTNINQIWDVFLADLRNLIKVEVCALFLVDEKTHEFVLMNASPQDKAATCQEELLFQIECGMFPSIINRRQPAVIPSLVFKNNMTIIMLPLSTLKGVLGAVFVLTPIEESAITQENMKLLTTLAKQCSLVMENTFLYDNLRKQHESLEKAQAQIVQSEKLASIGRLSSGASHEILNPLNIISGHIQFMLIGDDLDPRTLKSLNIMKEQSDRIARIVKGLLQFSKNTKSRTAGVGINHLIEKALRRVGEAEFNDINVIKDFDIDLPLLMVDTDSILQVFLNLILNAKEAMPQGGELKVSARLSENKDGLSEQPDFIEIRFQDNGCGISEQNMDKIFEPFFTTKEAGSGTGLGLSLSYGIVQEHGGSIGVESRENEGTGITINLPVITEPDESD